MFAKVRLDSNSVAGKYVIHSPWSLTPLLRTARHVFDCARPLWTPHHKAVQSVLCDEPKWSLPSNVSITKHVNTFFKSKWSLVKGAIFASMSSLYVLFMFTFLVFDGILCLALLCCEHCTHKSIDSLQMGMQYFTLTVFKHSLFSFDCLFQYSKNVTKWCCFSCWTLHSIHLVVQWRSSMKGGVPANKHPVFSLVTDNPPHVLTHTHTHTTYLFIKVAFISTNTPTYVIIMMIES